MSETFQMNITHTGPLRYEEEYKNLYEYISSKVFAVIIYTLVETVGNAFWGGIIHYELFGGDPMKRSITNKEISLPFKHLLHLQFDYLHIKSSSQATRNLDNYIYFDFKFFVEVKQI